MQNQLTRAQGVITYLQNRNTDLHTDFILLKEKQNKEDRGFSQLSELQGQLSELQGQLSELQGQLKSKDEELSEKNDQLEEAKSQYFTERQIHKQCQTSKRDAFEQLRTLKEKLKSSEKSLACARHKEDHATNQLKQERQACFKNVDDLRGLRIQFDGLNGKLENTESERDDLQKIVWKIREDKSDLQKQLTDANARADATQRKLEAAQQELASAKSPQSA